MRFTTRLPDLPMRLPTQWTMLLPVLASLALMCASAQAAKPASDTPADYRYHMELKSGAQQGVVSLRLPKDVYLNARSPALNDLRLFDAQGNKVPFSLYLPAVQSHLQRNTTPVIVFPVLANKASVSDTQLDLDIQTSANGSLLAVKVKGDNKKGSGKPALQSLIMDLQPAISSGGSDSKTKPLINALRFTLPASINNYSAQVWLEASDDLQHWDTIGTAELAWLQNSETQTLATDKLEFEPRRFRYARLSWRKGEPVEFTTITAQTVIQIANAPAIDTMEIQPQAGKLDHDLLYRAALAIPVESLNLQFVEPNIVFPASIGSYQELPSKNAGVATTWRFVPLQQATFYQIRQNDKQRHSGEIVLPATHNAEWIIRPQGPTTSKPVMQISWQPASLIFVTSGQPPYQLAFGRDNIASAAMELSQVAPDFSIAELQKLEQLNPGPLQQNAAPGNTTPSEAAATAASAKQRMWLLWGVLALGVLVLGAMAWNLVKQMKR